MEGTLEKLCELATWLQQHHPVQPADLDSRQSQNPVLGSSRSADVITGSVLLGAKQFPLGAAPEGSAAAEARNGSMQSQPGLSPVTLLALRTLLEFIDGCCCYFRGRTRPSAWVSHLLKALKAFDAPTRECVAATTQVGSCSRSKRAVLSDCLICVQTNRLRWPCRCTASSCSRQRSTGARLRRLHCAASLKHQSCRTAMRTDS